MRKLVRGILCVILVLAAAGCQSSGERDQESGNTASSAAAAQSEPITLTLLQFKAEIADQVMAMVDDYMAQHPNIVIDAQVLKDYDTTLVARFASGDAPDIFLIKAFTDIQDWSDRLADLSDEPWMEEVSPSAVQGMTVGDRKLGFPMSFEGYGFIYNKDLFAKAGIERAPRTLSELRQVNEKLREAGIVSYSEGYKEWWILGQHLLNLPFAYEQDPISTINELNQGEKTIADMDYMDGFFEVLDMTLEFGRGTHSVSASYEDQVSDFANGRTAMMQQGVWTIESIHTINPNIRMGMFAIPLSDDPSDTKMPVGVPGYYVLNKNSKHLQASKDFLNWLHQNGQRYLVDSFKLIPAFTDLKTTEDLGPLAADLHHYVSNNQTIPWAHQLWPSGTNQEFSNPLQDYIGGELNKEQTLKRLQAIWETQAANISRSNL